MIPNRPIQQPITQENPLWVSWHDTQMIPSLSPQTVMDYFCRKSNPFYHHICNNEVIRMQRLSMEHMKNMVGLEFILLHVYEPILYVIRKQHRHGPNDATPIADYYIIGGMVYKAPDLGNVINSRILSAVTNLQLAFEEASSYSRYHPNKGYYWDFSSNKALSEKSKQDANKDNTSSKDDNGTGFQMHRVDMLLAEMLRRFPPPIPQIVQQQHINQQLLMQQQQAQQGNSIQENNMPEGSNTAVANNGTMNPQEASPAPPQGLLEPKIENADMKPPPEKKVKMQN